MKNNIEFLMELPNIQDLEVIKLGNVKGVRITKDGDIYARGKLIDTYKDGKKLYNELMSLIVDYYD